MGKDRKYKILLRVLSEATQPLSAQQLAKATGGRLFTSQDAGHLLSTLESEGKVRRTNTTRGNLWELVR